MTGAREGCKQIVAEFSADFLASLTYQFAMLARTSTILAPCQGRSRRSVRHPFLGASLPRR